MSVITGGQVLGGNYGAPYLSAGAPSAGTSEVQSLTTAGTPAGGTFKLAYEGVTSGTIGYNAGTAAVQAALDAMNTLGTGNTLVAGSALNNAAGSPTTITFQGNLAQKNVSSLTLANNSLTGGTVPSVTIGTPTPGADATARDAATGELLIDVINGKLYINTSTTADTPTWTVVGSQS
jgi:hypothetical protein